MYQIHKYSVFRTLFHRYIHVELECRNPIVFFVFYWAYSRQTSLVKYFTIVLSMRLCFVVQQQFICVCGKCGGIYTNHFSKYDVVTTIYNADTLRFKGTSI